MLASAALGSVAGNRRASARPDGSASLYSTPGVSIDALPMLALSSDVSADSAGSSANLLRSGDASSTLYASTETASPAQEAAKESALASSQTDSAADSNSFLSAEQLWEGAWKAFEQPEQKQASSNPDTLPGTLAREQQPVVHHQSSFPSLAARFFRRESHSGAQDKR